MAARTWGLAELTKEAMIRYLVEAAAGQRSLFQPRKTGMEESRSRNFTHSGAGLIEIDGVAIHARWRMTGIQDYTVGAGAATDGLRRDVAVSVFFDKLSEQAELVDTLLERIQADQARKLECKLGRTTTSIFFREVRTSQSGAPSGVVFESLPRSEFFVSVERRRVQAHPGLGLQARSQSAEPHPGQPR